MRKVVWLVPSHENKWVLENAVFILCAQVSAFKLIFAQYGTALSVHQCMSKHARYLNNWKPQLGNNASIDKVVLATEFPLCSKYGQPFQSPNGFRIVLFERDPSQKKKKQANRVRFPTFFHHLGRKNEARLVTVCLFVTSNIRRCYIAMRQRNSYWAMNRLNM